MEIPNQTDKHIKTERRRRSRSGVLGALAAGIFIVTNSHNHDSTPPVESVIPTAVVEQVINGIEHGDSVQVTAEDVVLPGAVGETHGRPMVITYEGKTAFVYNQGTELDFDEDAATLASELAVVHAGDNIETTEAVIDKDNHLTVGIGTADQAVVGFAFLEESGK